MLDTRKKFRADAQYSTESQANHVRTRRIDRKSRTTGASGKTGAPAQGGGGGARRRARVRARIADYMQ